MDRKNVVLELKVKDRQVAPTESTQARQEAVSDAKRAVVSALSNLSCWDSSLEVRGLNNIFPVLVVTGPDLAINHLSEHVLDDLPDMVSRIERDMHFSVR